MSSLLWNLGLNSFSLKHIACGQQKKRHGEPNSWLRKLLLGTDILAFILLRKSHGQVCHHWGQGRGTLWRGTRIFGPTVIGTDFMAKENEW
jgi:hypothetical protein